MTEADTAFERARRLIKEARDNRLDTLDFDFPETRALDRFPAEIAALHDLRTLDCDNTNISDLAPLSGLKNLTGVSLSNTQVTRLDTLSGLGNLTVLAANNTRVSTLDELSGLRKLSVLLLRNTRVSSLDPVAKLEDLTRLWLDDTPVSDLRPLLGLRQLADRPVADGLTFARCTAAQNDARTAEIADIKNDAERAQTLFDYLDPLQRHGKPGAAQKASRPLAPAKHAQSQPFNTAVKRVSLRDIGTVFADSYPDLQSRTARLVELAQQQKAVHALVPCPNEPEAQDAYLAEAEFLDTMVAGLVSIYEDLPPVPKGEVPEADAANLRDKMLALARMADDVVRHLDADKGSYGSLYKIGLISAVAGVLSLVPGVNFAMGVVLPAAVFGYQIKLGGK